MTDAQQAGGTNKTSNTAKEASPLVGWILVVCGLVAFVWTVLIGVAVFLPSWQPSWLRPTCTSHTESTIESHTYEVIPKPAEPISKTGMIVLSGGPPNLPNLPNQPDDPQQPPRRFEVDEPAQTFKFDQTCQPPTIPSSTLYVAAGMTAFLLLSCVVPALSGLTFKAPGGWELSKKNLPEKVDAVEKDERDQFEAAMADLAR